MKKFVRMFLGITLAAALMLSGCSSTAAGSQTSAAPTGEGEPTEIVFWAAFSLDSQIGEGVTQLVDGFNESQDQYKVVVQPQEGYAGIETKLTAALLANDVPDIVMITSQTLERMYPTLESLETLLSQETVDNLVDGLRADATYEGSLKAIPFNRSMPIMFVNKDLLATKGYTPEDIKTWDDVEKIAAEFSDAATDSYGFESLIPTEMWQFYSLVDQMGGTVFAEDGKSTTIQEPAVRIMTFLNGMMENGSMKNPAKIPGAQAGDFDGDMVLLDDFYSGRTPMITLSTGYCGAISQETEGKFEPAAIVMPTWADGTTAVKPGGGCLGITSAASDEAKKGAAEFFEYLLSDESVYFMHTWTGYMPVTKSAAGSEQMTAFWEENPVFQAVGEQSQYVTPYERNERAGEVETILIDYNNQIMLGEATVEQAVESAVGEINDLLGKS